MVRTESASFSLGGIEIDPATSSVRRGTERHQFRPKTFQVLLYLAANRHRAVTKDELIDAIWPSVTVTEDTLVQSIADIRRAVDDDARDPWFIRTIPRVGYQLIADERGNRSSARHPRENASSFGLAQIEEKQSFQIAVQEEEGSDWRRVVIIAAAILAVGVLGAMTMLRRRSEPVAGAGAPAAPGKVVVFAPFDVRPGSPDLDWLREGLPGMLVTNLSSVRELRFINQGATLRASGEPSSEARLQEARWLEAAKKAGAERLIAGTIERSGDRIRVDARVVDVGEGLVIGGGSIVSGRETLLDDVDVLSERLAGVLGVRMTAWRDRARVGAMTNSLDAYDAYARGLAAAHGLRNLDAVAHFQNAIALDPEFAMAHARIGYVYAVTWANVKEAGPFFDRALRSGKRLDEHDRLSIRAWRAIADADYDRAIASYRLLLERYPTDVEARTRLGRLLIGEQRCQEAIEVLSDGLLIDPSAPELENAIGIAASYLGRHAEAIAHHRRYVELLPDEPNSHDSLALSHQWSGDYASALVELDRALELDPRFEVALNHRANVLWELGRNREAVGALEQYIAIAPSELERRRGEGQLYFIYRSMGDLTAAHGAARRALEGNPDRALGVLVALDRGENAEAARLGSAIPAANLANRGQRASMRDRYYIQAEAARASGDEKRAIDLAREAMRSLPPTYQLDAHEDVLADMLGRFRRYAEAATEYRRILTVNPNRGRTRYKLARVLEASGQTEEARSEYERFLKVWNQADADAPEIVDAKSRLGRMAGL